MTNWLLGKVVEMSILDYFSEGKIFRKPLYDPKDDPFRDRGPD